MLQNATGRYYGEEFWKLKVSVHGGFESVFWNYQSLIKEGKGSSIKFKKQDGSLFITAQEKQLYGPFQLRSQRTPVYQQELYNGHLWIFIRGDERLVGEIEDALSSPSKVLSLGRSEDVIFIKKVREVTPEKTKEVQRNLRLTYPTYIKQKKFPLKNNQYSVYSTPTKVLFKNKGVVIKNKSELTKETKREPKFETVLYTGLNFTAYLKEAVNVDVFSVDKKTFKIPEQGWV